MSIKVVNIFVSFLKVSWVNGGPPHFSENVEAPECLSSLKIICIEGCKYFSMILKDSWSAWRSETFI